MKRRLDSLGRLVSRDLAAIDRRCMLCGKADTYPAIKTRYQLFDALRLPPDCSPEHIIRRVLSLLEYDPTAKLRRICEASETEIKRLQGVIATCTKALEAKES